MNKKISDLFDSYDGEINMEEKTMFEPERIKANTLSKIKREKIRPVRRRLKRTLLIAAAVACFLAVPAYAVARQMNYRFLEEGEKLKYTIVTDKLINKDDSGYHYEEKDMAFENATMVIKFEGREESKEYCIKANWLPEDYPCIASTYSMHLAFANLYQAHPGEYGTKPEEALKEAGMTEEEANEWCLGYDCDAMIDGVNMPLYEVSIIQPTDLYVKDIIIGPYGGEAEIVKEDKFKSWQMLEVCHRWDSYAEQHILFLYDLDEEYLIMLVGTVDFATLEKIAENLEVKETERTIHSVEQDWFNYILAFAGVG